MNMELTEEQKANSLKWDADAVMEQLIMQESRHMQMSALVEHQLMYPDMTIREFFAMARQELDDQDEELEEQEEYREEHIDLSLEENAEWDNSEVMEEED
tara:strand:- start:54 stop:353 length:300 start_codon:yes stop_codon:yes gene_type:complete